MDYNHIPFKCRYCQEYNHLACDCNNMPNNKASDHPTPPKEQSHTQKKGGNKGKNAYSNSQPNRGNNVASTSSNAFYVLKN